MTHDGILVENYEMRHCRHGKMVYIAQDQWIGKCLRDYGEWSEAEVSLYGQFLRPGDVAIEAGANIGTHTLPLSRLVGPHGRVIAFEPQRHIFQLLCANLVLNECLNVEAKPAAVGAEIGKIDFPLMNPREPNNFGAASIYTAWPTTETVDVVTIDSLGLQRLDFIKSDVEAFEPQLLAGATRTIDALRPIIYLEFLHVHGEGDCTPFLRNFFAERNYRLLYFVTPIYLDSNYRGNPVDAFKGMGSFDMLCLPDEKATATGFVDAATDGWSGIVTETYWQSCKVTRR